MNYDMSQSMNSFNNMRDYIPKEATILDFGSGRGYIANLISHNISKNIVCVDVIDIKDNPLPLIIYDGKKLPLKNKQFDVSLCLFVLHHTADQDNLLRELSRVTKKRIIIMEDLPETLLDKILTVVHRITSYFRYNSKQMLFRTNEEWLQLFKRYNFEVEIALEIPMLRNLGYPIHRKMYVLNPRKS